MRRVLLVVEGQTERGLVEQVLARYVAEEYGIDLRGMVVGKPGHKGGNVHFERVAGEVVRLLKQEPASTVGTFVDLYQIESDWPGIPPGHGRRPLTPVPVSRVAEIEDAVAKAIGSKAGGELPPWRFVPYIQVHEIEALFFSGPEQMASVFGQPHSAKLCAQVVQECGGCEQINHGEKTHPARRISDIFGRYRKGDGLLSDAIPIAKAIGVPLMREQCPRFDAWLTRLANLGKSA